MSSENSAANPPGFIPFYGQGLRAKESQLGAIGTKEWLKYIKLHKYWPLISHWSYWQMMALSEDNIEYNIKIVRGTGITRGAQGKLLRSIEELRERKTRLKKIIEDLRSGGMTLEAELSYLMKVVYTPIPTSEEDSLPTLIVYSVQKIKEHMVNQNSTDFEKITINKIDSAVRRNSILYRAEEHLKSIPFIWEIQSTLTNYAVRSSRILPRILRERNRSTSIDSGFEEDSNNTDVSSISPDVVMLELPTGNEYHDLLHTPLYL